MHPLIEKIIEEDDVLGFDAMAPFIQSKDPINAAVSGYSNLFHMCYSKREYSFKKEHIEAFLKLDNFDPNARVIDDYDSEVCMFTDFVDRCRGNHYSENDFVKGPECLELWLKAGLNVKDTKSKNGASLFCFCMERTTDKRRTHDLLVEAGIKVEDESENEIYKCGLTEFLDELLQS